MHNDFARYIGSDALVETGSGAKILARYKRTFLDQKRFARPGAALFVNSVFELWGVGDLLFSPRRLSLGSL